MAGCLSDPEIELLHAGNLSPSELKRAQAHLDRCPMCRRRVAETRRRYEAGAATTLSLANARHAVESPARPPLHEDEDAPVISDALPRIEGYNILSRIHSGAQGVVYKAVQQSTSRTVAVKLLPHGHAATDRQKQRFEREVGLAASLRHPNIVTVYDSGLASGRYFFAMEYVHGRPLDEYLNSANLSVADKLRLFATICSAVGYAHQRGVIHRDLKPANILVDASGEPHIVDFGLAKSAGALAAPGATPITLTSQFMGTLAYASPEQTKGDPALVDTRSDVYALGVILHEMLTGKHPYPVSRDLVQMFQTICHAPPEAPSQQAAGISADIDTIVLRALAKEPERRYQTVAELQEDVERWLRGEPISARRDSAIYMLRVRGRALMKRHQVSTAALIVIAAWLLVEYPGGYFFQRIWNQPAKWYESVALGHFAPPPAGPVFEDVRIVVMTDETNDRIADLARAAGLHDVSAEQPRSLRRLHGLLMKKLAEAEIGGVAWDLLFRAPRDEQDESFTRDLAEGALALRQAGVEPIFAIAPWTNDPTPNDLAPQLLEPGFRFAIVTLRDDLDPNVQSWHGMDLAVQCGHEVMQSLALQAATQMRHAGPVHALLDCHGRTLRLEHQRADGRPQRIVYHPISRCVIEDGCDVAVYYPVLPSESQFQQVTLLYHDLLAADHQRLRQLVRGKLLVIGDARSTATDVVQTADGRSLHGVFLHAAAADALRRESPVLMYAAGTLYGGIVLLGGALGVVCALPWWGAPHRRTLAILAALLLLALLWIALVRQMGVLVSPFSPGLAMLVALIAGLALLRAPHDVSSSPPSRRSRS